MTDYGESRETLTTAEMRERMVADAHMTGIERAVYPGRVHDSETCPFCGTPEQRMQRLATYDEALDRLRAAAEAVLPEHMEGATVLVGIERWSELRAAIAEAAPA